MALLCGRNAISSDVNDVAVCLTKAKTTTLPSLGRLNARVSESNNELNAKKCS
jgi:hypothetical protein